MRRMFVLLFVCVVLLALLGAPALAAEKAAAPEKTGADFTIAVEVGTPMEAAAKEAYPDATYIYLNSQSDLYMAVASGQADACAADKVAFETALRAGLTGLEAEDHTIGEVGNVAIGISREGNLPDAQNMINSFLAEMRSTGVLDDMYKRWVADGNYTLPDIPAPESPERVIRVGTTGLVEPYSFYAGDKLTGYEVELMSRLALWANADIQVSTYDWAGIITSCGSGKVDLCMSNLFDTAERREVIDFSEPYLVVATVMVYQEGAVAGESGSFTARLSKIGTNIASSFEKTFIREGRWRLILSGLATTLLMSVLSAVVGTVLGFGLCQMRRGKSKFASGLAAFIIRLVQGVPIVVLLMVLYYIVFASSPLSGVMVATIGFSLNFSVYVAEMMRTGIAAVDRGQWEAADALGFSGTQTFIKVIAPQALRHVVPVYKGEFISMLKMTSVVGYIGIQDLTKAGDIIRSRTYEAFFPLIATAVIYFLLAWLLGELIGRVEISADPNRRSRMPEGVDIDKVQDEVPDGASRKGGSSESVITIEHLCKAYPKVTPLKDVNAVINRGDVVTVIGPSGTGKSTLLRCINRLEEPTGGSISIFGGSSGKKADICAMRQRVGMVFQSFNLFPHLTVIENIMLAPVKLKGLSRQEAYERGMELLRAVGLAEKAFSYPDELSGGQKQRVAIARTLAMEPEIVLFDEPTSALDPTMVGEVLSVIRGLAAKGLTMMIVTHEMKFARDVSSRVFYMDEGVIYEDGTPEQVFDSPLRDKTRAFVNHLKVFELSITSRDYDFIAVQESLQRFGEKQFMTQKQLDAMRRCFEELCSVNILPQIKEPFKLTVKTEFSEESKQIVMSFDYTGDEYNPLESGDELSILMAKTEILQSEFSFRDDRNHLRIVL